MSGTIYGYFSPSGRKPTKNTKPLTPEQKARIAENKQKALEIRKRKQQKKTPIKGQSLRHLFSPKGKLATPKLTTPKLTTSKQLVTPKQQNNANPNSNSSKTPTAQPTTNTKSDESGSRPETSGNQSSPIKTSKMKRKRFTPPRQIPKASSKKNTPTPSNRDDTSNANKRPRLESNSYSDILPIKKLAVQQSTQPKGKRDDRSDSDSIITPNTTNKRKARSTKSMKDASSDDSDIPMVRRKSTRKRRKVIYDDGMDEDDDEDFKLDEDEESDEDSVDLELDDDPISPVKTQSRKTKPLNPFKSPSIAATKKKSAQVTLTFGKKVPGIGQGRKGRRKPSTPKTPKRSGRVTKASKASKTPDPNTRKGSNGTKVTAHKQLDAATLAFVEGARDGRVTIPKFKIPHHTLEFADDFGPDSPDPSSSEAESDDEGKTTSGSKKDSFVGDLKGELPSTDTLDRFNNFRVERDAIASQNNEYTEPQSTPKKKKKRTTFFKSPKKSPGRSGFKSTPSATSKRRFGSSAATHKKRTGNAGENMMSEDWFKDPKDRNGNHADHPDYDPSSIHVPHSVFNRLTNAMKIYWEIKSRNWDTILFFKVGKFYEIYDNDALICHKELGLNFMGNENRPHVGMPEVSFEKYAEQLVKTGHKVGRVDQMETKNQMKERIAREKRAGKKPINVMKREITTVLTPGTLMSPDIIGHHDANFTLAVVGQEEKVETPIYGVSFVDTAGGNFWIGQFTDDRNRTRLRTLIAQLQPAEVVYERTSLNKQTLKLFPYKVIHNKLQPAECWDSQTTVSKINAQDYFKDDSGKITWPDALEGAKKDELAMDALGRLVWYLRRLLLDKEVMALSEFHRYDPADLLTAGFLALDGLTLENLEIFKNGYDHSNDGTLKKFMDRCVTPFGHRMFSAWLQRPLFRINDINERLDVIDDLMTAPDVAKEAIASLKGMPDLERLLLRIHAHASRTSASGGPVMYENLDKKRIRNFLRVLDGLEKALGTILMFSQNKSRLKSTRLSHLTTIGIGFPDIYGKLQECRRLFDAEAALLNGYITPKRGVYEDFDDVCATINENEAELDAILAKYRRLFQDKSIRFIHKQNETYQITIKSTTVNKHDLPDELFQTNATKTTKAYRTEEIVQLADVLEKAKTLKIQLQNNMLRKIFQQFCEHMDDWNKAISCISEVDCLLSLYQVSIGVNMCRPEFVDTEAQAPFIELRNSWHPCVQPNLLMCGTDEFIPNDIVIGTDENPNSFVMVTGPNMGGKSTVLRQACVSAVMAQMGCYVTAQKCRLTPIDRIFTRIGASDDIMQNRSTFYVELEETSNILRHATKNSLVILDELGRGTSTFDGTAIAFAVAKYISYELRCRCLFSTHYHILTEDEDLTGNISKYHMACEVNDKDNVTFLYKFVPGIAHKSHGTNCARLAGLPENIIDRAGIMSEEFERQFREAYISGGGEEKSKVPDHERRFEACFDK